MTDKLPGEADRRLLLTTKGVGCPRGIGLCASDNLRKKLPIRENWTRKHRFTRSERPSLLCESRKQHGSRRSPSRLCQGEHNTPAKNNVQKEVADCRPLTTCQMPQLLPVLSWSSPIARFGQLTQQSHSRRVREPQDTRPSARTLPDRPLDTTHDRCNTLSINIRTMYDNVEHAFFDR